MALTEQQEKRLAEYEARKAEKDARKQSEKEAKAKRNMETIKTQDTTAQNADTVTAPPSAPKADANAGSSTPPPPPITPVNPASDYTPFAENPENRAYTKPAGNEPIPDIPEPKVTPTGNIGATTEEPKIVNPAMVKASEEEQNLGAEQLADTVLLAYEKLHGVAKYFTKIDTAKITQLGIEDKINPNLQISTGKEDGSTITIGEFFTSANSAVDEALNYDKSFNDKVKPPMVRVFKKHNWGLTDEQTLLIAFGQDIAEKTAICMGLSKTINGVLEVLIKQHASTKPPAANEPQTPSEPTIKTNQRNKREKDIYDKDIIEPEEATIIDETRNT